MKVIVLALFAAGLMSLVFGFHLTTGFSPATAPHPVIHTTVNTYPVPTMPATPHHYGVTVNHNVAPVPASKPSAARSASHTSTRTGSTGSTAYTQTSTSVRQSTSVSAKGARTNSTTTTTTVKVHK